MAVLATNNTQEGFIVQMNGDYNTAFDALSITVAGKSGDVIAVGSSYGILAKDKGVCASLVRVMVRGNPTTVNARALDFKGLNVTTVTTALAVQGIIIVNK